MTGFTSYPWLRIVVWSALGFAAPLLWAADGVAQARSITAEKPPLDVSLTLDVTTLMLGQHVMARSTAGAAGEVVAHGVNGRALGGRWRNWEEWDDKGGVAQVAFPEPEGTGIYELRAYAARADESPAFSDSVFLTVSGVAPTITTQPASAIASVGETVNFSVVAEGSALAYQWTRDGGNVGGATGATLTLSSVQLAQGGAYRVVVSNSAGVMRSNAATLTVVAAGLLAVTVDAWQFPVSGGRQAVAQAAVRVGDVVTLTATERLTAGAGWRHNVLIRRPGVSEANALPPEDGSGLTETVEGWNKDGWGNPHAENNSYDWTVTGLLAPDLGYREPFIHPLAYGQPGSTRTFDLVLDAPGTWLFKTEVVDGGGQQVAVSAPTSVTVAPAALAGDAANFTYPYGRPDRFVGVFWSAGQAHRLFSTWRADHMSAYRDTWAVNWQFMWQPSPYFRKPDGTWLRPDPVTESPWQAFWSAHQVYALIPDGLGGSKLTHDITSQAFAEKAALRLMDVGVDFVTIDYTNMFLEPVETVWPAMNNLVQAFQVAAAQAQSMQRIKVCALVPVTVEGGDWGYNGGFIPRTIAGFSAKLTTLYTRFANNPATWFYLEDDNNVRKPLLMLWIGADGAGEPDGRLAPARLSQLKLADGRLMTDVFTIRWVGAYMAGNPRFATGGRYTVRDAEGAVSGAYLQPKFWSYRERHPAGATLSPPGQGPGVEAITIQPDAAGRDRFGREWLENWPAGTGFHYETPANGTAIPLDDYGRIWGQALGVARGLDPKFLMTTWLEFGSENDEPRPEMSVTIMDNNKFGTHFGDAFKQTVRMFKYRAPQCWIDTYTYGGVTDSFATTPVAAWRGLRQGQTIRLQGWVTPNVAATFPDGSVKVHVDNATVGSATVGGAWNGGTGWYFDLATTAFGPGRHVITIVAEDGIGGAFQAGVQFQGEVPQNVLPLVLLAASGPNQEPDL